MDYGDGKNTANSGGFLYGNHHEESPERTELFHSEEQSAALWLVCRQVAPQRYDFSISDSDSAWTKEAVMELCSMLLQCPEVDNVLVGQVPSHQQDVKVTVSPMVTFLHTVKNYLQPQRIRMILRRLRSNR